jgi:hypothetical protein
MPLEAAISSTVAILCNARHMDNPTNVPGTNEPSTKKTSFGKIHRQMKPGRSPVVEALSRMWRSAGKAGAYRKFGDGSLTFLDPNLS